MVDCSINIEVCGIRKCFFIAYLFHYYHSFFASKIFVFVKCDFCNENGMSSAWYWRQSDGFGITSSSERRDIQGIHQLHQERQGTRVSCGF